MGPPHPTRPADTCNRPLNTPSHPPMLTLVNSGRCGGVGVGLPPKAILTALNASSHPPPTVLKISYTPSKTPPPQTNGNHAPHLSQSLKNSSAAQSRYPARSHRQCHRPPSNYTPCNHRLTSWPPLSVCPKLTQVGCPIPLEAPNRFRFRQKPTTRSNRIFSSPFRYVYTSIL
jgi:hypothetical protein